MKKLSTYLLEHKFGYLLGFLSMVIAVSLDMVSPQLTRHIIDDVIVGGDLSRAEYLLGGILLVGAADAYSAIPKNLPSTGSALSSPQI